MVSEMFHLRLNSMQCSDVPHDDTDKFWDRENDPLSCVNSNTPAINVDFNSGNPEETQNSLVFPNSPTGIPPPPLFKSPQISFERLTNLLNTPPSPICSDNGAESLSTFSSVIIPRSTNDSSLRARSDTLLSTHSCHSKYDHRYSREHNLASPSNDEFSKRKLYITTHVDDQPVHSKFDEFTKAFDPFEKYHISSDLFELDSALSNNDEKIEEYSVTSLAPTTDIDAQIRISPCIPTPSDEFNSEPSSEEDIIVLRPPPPIPTAVRFNELDNNADLINDQIEFSNISVFSRTNPLPTGSVPLQQIFQEEIVVPVSEPIPYQPVARKRNRTSKFNNYSEHSIIPEAPPRAEVSSFSTNEILQRPPSMFAERYSYPGLSIEINEVQECNESKIEEVPPTSYDHDRLNSIDLEKGTNFLLFDANKSKNSNNAITSEAQSQIENVQVADDVKLQLSLHESIFSQFDPVRIFTDSDPNLNQFQNLIPASIPHSNVVIGLPFTIDRTLESQLDHSEATDEHLDSNSICDHFQVVSNETKTRLSEADCTNEVLHQDSGLETSIESTNLPPDITDSSTFTQDDDEQLSKQSVSICDGSIEIRSARSIELFDCYPDYELPNRPSPPYYSLQTIPFNSRCNDIFEKKDLSPPPLPMSAPPELEDTD
ncbi:hypothetical protein LOD99_8623 [Oopsacas minuta]|uniref:Uncharacterized protein n=1 Tax=Oopsacas minuta TaxID=111878 RepID=A0AAV7JFT9_9METZ|nr:hypothetical protein LOD99_8623 [Oopsacas minuta]